MENVINFKQYQSKYSRSNERQNVNGTPQNADVILFTGVRFEYGKNEPVPGGPPKPARRKLRDI